MNKHPLILMIDDNISILETISFNLMAEGFFVSLATDGQAALNFLVQKPLPDLIVLDIKMPHVNGIDFRKVQMTDQNLKNIPVVVFSSELDQDTELRSLGLDIIIDKNPRTLIQTLKNFFTA